MSGGKKSDGPEEDLEDTEEDDNEGADDEEGSNQDAQSSDEDEEMEDIEDVSGGDDESSPQDKELSTSSRKRKRGGVDDNLEESYMRRIAQEEAKEEVKRHAQKAKRLKADDKEENDDSSDAEENESSGEEDGGSPPPKHEALTGDAQAAIIDKSNRTVFLGNVSTKAIMSKSAKKTLLTHLSSFLSTLPEAEVPHKVESLRFRSTAYTAAGGAPKRAAYAKKELMNETTPSTNAYVVYTTAQAARKASAALNGTVVLDRHLRVDSVAHPAPVDNKRCVFVGNLDFVDQEPEDDDEDDEKKKKKKKPTVPADVEEGLWRTFNEETRGVSQVSGRGNVESVRVVRDRTTRVGKGFAYVQFYDPNCVEAALLLDGKKFPPLLPRKLRVTRARKVQKRRESGPASGANSRELGVGSAHSSLRGRAAKLLGRAGAAKLKEGGSGPKSKSNEPFIFEGYRASEGAPKFKIKTKSRGAAKGKPKTRSSRRAAAYKTAGGRKGAKERNP